MNRTSCFAARASVMIALGVTACTPVEGVQLPAQREDADAPATVEATNFPQGAINRVSEALIERTEMLVRRVIVPWNERPRDPYRRDDAMDYRTQIQTDRRAINELHAAAQERFRVRRLALEPTKDTAATRAKLQELAAAESDLNTVLMPMYTAAGQALLEPNAPDAIEKLRTLRGRTVASESLRRVLLSAALIEKADPESLREASQLITQILELPEGKDPRRACPSTIVSWALVLSSLHELPTPDGTRARIDSRVNDLEFRSLHAIAQARAMYRGGAKDGASLSRAAQPLIKLLEDNPPSACWAMAEFVRVADVSPLDRPYIVRAMLVGTDDIRSSFIEVLAQRESFRTLPLPLRSLIVDRLTHSGTLDGVYRLPALGACVDALAPFVEKDAPPDLTENAKIDTLIAAARTLMTMDSGGADEFAAVARGLLDALAAAAQRDAVHLGPNAEQRRSALLWLPVAVALAPGAPPGAIERAGNALSRALSAGEANAPPRFVTTPSDDSALVITRLWQVATALANDTTLQGIDAAGALRSLETTLAQIEHAGIAGSKGLTRAASFARAVSLLRAAPAGNANIPEADRLIDKALTSPVGRVPSSGPSGTGFVDELLRARWANELSKAGRHETALRINRELTERLADTTGNKDASLREAFWLAWAGTLEELARVDAKANATEIRLQLRRLKGIDSSLGGRDMAERFRAIDAALPPI